MLIENLHILKIIFSGAEKHQYVFFDLTGLHLIVWTSPKKTVILEDTKKSKDDPTYQTLHITFCCAAF